MWYEITPLDTLFFKDGRPFLAGRDLWAKSTFPPFPSVYRGALRSCYFSNNMEHFHKAAQKDDPTERIKIGMSCIIAGDKILFPMPYDMVINAGRNKSVKLHMEENTGVSSYPCEFLLSGEETDKNSEVGPDNFILLEDLEKYLASEEMEFDVYNMTDYYSLESKTGIALEKGTRNTKQSMLYQIHSIRAFDRNDKPLKMLVEMDERGGGVELPEKTVIKLGGNSKGAAINRVADINLDFRQQIKTGDLFKCYLTSPSIFEKGWLPSFLDEETLEGEYRTDSGISRLKLVAAAVERYVCTGGFDMKANKPKKMYRAVPAGSVYYFRVMSGNIEAAASHMMDNRLTDMLAEDGFGCCMTGRV